MTARHADGCDMYGAIADAALRCNIIGSPNFLATGGWRGGGAFHGSIGAQHGIEHVFDYVVSQGTGKKGHIGVWIKFNQLPPPSLDTWQFGSLNTDTYPMPLYIHADGSIEVMRAADSAPFSSGGKSPPGIIVPGEWNHFEFKVNITTSAPDGVCVVYVSRVPVINLTGVATQSFGTNPTFIRSISLYSSLEHEITWDDVIAHDEDGTVDNWSQLPHVHYIEEKEIDGDVAVSWTPSAAGTHYTLLDEVPFHDGDATYVQGATLGQIDRFSVADQAATPQDALFFGVHTVAKKTDPTPVTVRNLITVSATDYEGIDHLQTTNYAHYADYWGKNPSTSAAWDPSADFNALEVGIKFQA